VGGCQRKKGRSRAAQAIRAYLFAACILRHHLQRGELAWLDVDFSIQHHGFSLRSEEKVEGRKRDERPARIKGRLWGESLPQKLEQFGQN